MRDGDGRRHADEAQLVRDAGLFRDNLLDDECGRDRREREAEQVRERDRASVDRRHAAVGAERVGGDGERETFAEALRAVDGLEGLVREDLP